MKMNLPNKLTTFRILLVPFFVLFFLLSMYEMQNFNVYRIISAVIFIIASFTDFLDGHIARKYNLVTNYGKLMDPLADKILVVTAIILLSYCREINIITTIVIIIREFSISSIRLVALENGSVIHASKLGKIKTASQMIAIILFLFNIHKINNSLMVLTNILYYVSFIFVIISLIEYIIKNWHIMLDKQ